MGTNYSINSHKDWTDAINCHIFSLSVSLSVAGFSPAISGYSLGIEVMAFIGPFFWVIP